MLKEVKRFEFGFGVIIYFGNVFEDDNKIIIDGMFVSDFEVNKMFGNIFDFDG